ncbi:MAG: SDR family oxidoreductase [Planctomycetes bacterium]|nr:SDR family oxidoreductase [Planctomycetota bacterium]
MTILERFRLDGRVALVTGGSKGIGKAIAGGFAESGARAVLIAARDASQLAATADELRSRTGVEIRSLAVDLARRESADELAGWALDQCGAVDILINNAGTNHPQELVEITDAVWDRIVELNFTSCMRLARRLAPRMIERRWGRIVHVSSVMALASTTGRGVYSGTKAALIGMTRAHALELGPHGITVNCIAPGPILTDLPMGILTERQKAQFAERTAVKRWGDPDDIVGPALLFASEAGRNLTGSVIVSDGGATCRMFD